MTHRFTENGDLCKLEKTNRLNMGLVTASRFCKQTAVLKRQFLHMAPRD